jgi:hypothetical protein
MITDKLKVVSGVVLVSLFMVYSGVICLATPFGKVTELTVWGAQEGKMLWQGKNGISCYPLYGLGGTRGLISPIFIPLKDRLKLRHSLLRIRRGCRTSN